MKKLSVLFSGFLVLLSCHKARVVETSFYYWKTVYRNNQAEQAYLHHFKAKKLYIRITDVGLDTGSNTPAPVSPIVFNNHLPDSIEIVPVVFVINDLLRTQGQEQLNLLAAHIARFVTDKVKQAGKAGFSELQMDCDWTASTRENYFYLLRRLKANALLKGKVISATLRLHQLKNQTGSGIPPADRVMLMCYNMGDLRKYGSQNSILDLKELKRYAGQNISRYPLPLDIGLPLFSWAVAFREKQYAGISKRISLIDLHNKNQFIFTGNNLYQAVTDLPYCGLLKDDEVRWEQVSTPELAEAASYLSRLIKTDSINVVYFHLDETVLAAHNFADLEKVDNIFH
jgi:hypothetical protein